MTACSELVRSTHTQRKWATSVISLAKRVPASSSAVQHTGWNGKTAAHCCLGTIIQRLYSHLSTAVGYKVKRARVRAPVLSVVLLFPRIMRNTRTWAGHTAEVVAHVSPASLSCGPVGPFDEQQVLLCLLFFFSFYDLIGNEVSGDSNETPPPRPAQAERTDGAPQRSLQWRRVLIYQTACQSVQWLQEIMESATARKWSAAICMLMKWKVKKKNPLH